MARVPDPGGNFASELHRRAACALPNPDEGFQSPDWMMARVARDDHFGRWVGLVFIHVSAEELNELIQDLEADGDAEHDDNNNWRLTEQGHTVLTGRSAFVGPGQTAEEAGRDWYATH